jgi:hypothetical protein
VAKKTIEFELDRPPDEVLEICREVARDRRWEIERVVSGQFVAARPHTPGVTKKLTVTVDLESRDTGTHVRLTGYIFGIPMPGPHAKAANEWRDTLVYEASRRGTKPG